MKILFFSSGSIVSGLEVVSLALAQGLAQAGWEVRFVVTGWNDGDYPSRLAAAHIPFKAIKLGAFYRTKPLWTLDTLAHLPGALRASRQFATEFSPDVVVHIDIAAAYWPTRLIRRGRHLLWVHDVPNNRYDHAPSRGTLARLRGMISVSDFIAAGLREKAPGLPVITVHNGVPAPESLAEHDRPDGGEVRLGIIGQVNPRKAHDLVLAAISRLPEAERARVKLKIFGNDKAPHAAVLRDEAERLGITRQVEWMGFVKSQAEIYGQLDIVCAPASDEPFGTTVLEAGAFGLPAIAAASGGYPEMLADEETGLLMRPGDAAHLAEQIGRLARDAGLRQRLGAAARARVTTEFTVSAMVGRFMAAVTQLAG